MAAEFALHEGDYLVVVPVVSAHLHPPPSRKDVGVRQREGLLRSRRDAVSSIRAEMEKK